jgi:hypothetical protein
MEIQAEGQRYQKAAEDAEERKTSSRRRVRRSASKKLERTLKQAQNVEAKTCRR